MKKYNKNIHWFKCPYCGYYGDKETLLERKDAIELKDSKYSIICPRCDSESFMED